MSLWPQAPTTTLAPEAMTRPVSPTPQLTAPTPGVEACDSRHPMDAVRRSAQPFESLYGPPVIAPSAMESPNTDNTGSAAAAAGNSTDGAGPCRRNLLNSKTPASVRTSIFCGPVPIDH